MEWLFRTDFDPLTTIALWTIAGVFFTTLLLFGYTIGLRHTTVATEKRRHRFRNRFQDVFASAVLDIETAQSMPLPDVRPGDYIDLLEEWNKICTIVDGAAARNLIVLADRLNIPGLADDLICRKSVASQIMAVQTFGHLRDVDRFDTVKALLDTPNTALSVTAATSLVQIDPRKGIDLVVPKIQVRRDWPKNKTSILLRIAGSELVSEPLYRAIRSADKADKAYLLQFTMLMESDIRDALVDELIRESNDAGVLIAALKQVGGHHGVPRVAALSQHSAWFVRMQIARVLGRVGQREHVGLLENLLSDREWWVRYRAAQSLTAMPFMGPNELRRLHSSQSDPYAADILQQAFAEAGLT